MRASGECSLRRVPRAMITPGRLRRRRHAVPAEISKVGGGCAGGDSPARAGAAGQGQAHHGVRQAVGGKRS